MLQNETLTYLRILCPSFSFTYSEIETREQTTYFAPSVVISPPLSPVEQPALWAPFTVAPLESTNTLFPPLVCY